MKLKLGIFDSGIGGFTVLNSLLSRLSDIDIIYLADTERNPFGEKRSEEIRIIAFEISKWFKNKRLDALLIACNTTNACALDVLKDNLNIPCFDLINSAPEKVSSDSIGVLATSATTQSFFYKSVLESKFKGIKVFQQSCPEFVSEIEKLPLDLIRINTLAELYLKQLLKKNVKEIILGCSHYPLIYPLLRRKIPTEIRIIDPSKALVEKVIKFFPTLKPNCFESLSYSDVKFFATGNINQFSLKVSNWLEINKEISLVNLRTDT